METHVSDYVKQCLCWLDSSAEEEVPHSFEETAHDARPGEVLRFDFLHVGESGLLGESGLGEGDGFEYTVVMVDDRSNFVCLEPGESCTAATTVKHLLT